MSASATPTLMPGSLAATDADVAWGDCCRAGADTCSPRAPMPWFRLAVGLFVASQTMLFGLAVNLTPPDDDATRLMLQGAMLAATLLVMGMLGWPMLADAVRAALQRRVTMEMLFVVSTLGAFVLSTMSVVRGDGPVYFDVVAVLLIVYSIGRAVSTHSRRRALAAMHELTDSLGLARRIPATDMPGITDDQVVPVSQIQMGDLVRVLPGELIPVDGRVVQGASLVREAAFTGEWLPPRRGPGDRVIAGTACEDGALVVRATAAGVDRRADRLAALIDEARRQPSRLQRQADRFVQAFLPLVLVVCVGTFAWWTWTDSIHVGLFNALAVLLIACPCAAGLAPPLGLWTVLGRLARRGLMLRGGDALEALATADSVIFDKTGTLGDERLAVERFDLLDDRQDRAHVLAIVGAVERHSTHPIAAALRELDGGEDRQRVTVESVTLLPGRGIEAQVTLADGASRQVRIVRDERTITQRGLAVCVLFDGQPVARAIVRERLRDSAEQTVADLRQLGLTVRIMTGDAGANVETVGGLAPVDAGFSPEDKHRAVAQLRQQPGYRRPIFVGDGFNDAAAMGAAHLDVALAHGSTVTVEAAAATLHDGQLDLLPRAIVLARRVHRVIRSNLALSVTYNVAGIALAAMGMLHPIVAALIMAASSALVSWRTFHATDRLSDDVREDVPPSPRATATTVAGTVPEARPAITGRRLAIFQGLHMTGVIGQGLILALIAGLSALWGGMTVVAFVGLAAAVLWLWPRLPAWADMTMAMVTLGGFGMNLGWWADLGFTAATPGMGCGCCAAGEGDTLFALNLLSGMNIGMLALGVPAMFLLRYRPEPFDLRRWCCTGMIVLGIPGMVIGMMAGSVLAQQWGAALPHVAMIGLDYVLMMAGMCAGMLLPHALEHLVPRHRGSEPA